MNDRPADSMLTAAADGDADAWRDLVRHVGPSVLAFARARGAHDPEDVLGDVLVGLVRGIGTFEGDVGGFKAWALRIAHSRVVDEHRRAARRPTVPVAEPPDVLDGEDLAETLVRSAWLREAVSELPTLHRDVLLLRVVAGLSAEETAEIVGKQPGAVRTIQHRALARLRNTLMVEL